MCRGYAPGQPGFSTFLCQKTWLFLYTLKFKHPYVCIKNQDKRSLFSFFCVFSQFSQYARNSFLVLYNPQNNIIGLFQGVQKSMFNLFEVYLLKVIYTTVYNSVRILDIGPVFRQKPNKIPIVHQ